VAPLLVAAASTSTMRQSTSARSTSPITTTTATPPAVTKCDIVDLGRNVVDYGVVTKLFGGLPMIWVTRDVRLGGRASADPKLNMRVFFVFDDSRLGDNRFNDPSVLRRSGSPRLRSIRVSCEDLRRHSSWVGAA
jgi:hypothetical protein